MIQITLDPGTVGKLAQLNSAAELCDPSGRVLGKFIPKMDLSEWEPVSPDVTEEELDAREKSTEWYTTSEVLAHLKKLENP